MFLLSLVVLWAVFAINRHLRRKAQEQVSMARYHCPSCLNDFILPFTPGDILCPVCGPLFAEAEQAFS